MLLPSLFGLRLCCFFALRVIINIHDSWRLGRSALT
jgi:hypothetical protein